MRNFNLKQWLPIPVLIMVLGGCILVSGTFVIVKDFDFTADSGSYFYQVDITEEPDWKDNKDKIDFVDAVGMEFNFINEGTSAVTFNVWIDSYDSLIVSPPIPTRPSTATQIISNLSIPAGTTHITYAESLKYLINLDRIKALALSGQFNYWGTSTGANGTFTVQKGKVIVTFSAGT